MFQQMRNTTLLLLLLTGVLWAGEITQVGEPIALSKSGQIYISPKWSPLGSQLAVAGVKYSGIYLINFPSGEMSQLTAELGAGYGFSWSPDGAHITARTATYEDHIKLSQIKVFALDGSSEALSQKQSLMTGLPIWSRSGASIHLKSQKSFQTYSLGKQVDDVEAGSLLFLHNLGIYKRDFDTGTDQLVSAPGQRVLHLALSPLGTHFVYSTVGEYLWIADMDGSNRQQLGRGTAPTWSPDGKWIASMITEDDGHVFTGSDILIYRASNGTVSKLTATPDIYEMHPTWSPDGKWLAYDNEHDGRIWVIQVEEN
jgi:Tol biopolymer transport system component